MQNYDSDIVVVGAGLTGLCLVSILSSLEYKIILIDRNELNFHYFEKSDFRATALSEGSKKILDKHSLWKNIDQYIQCINKIKIIDRVNSNKIDFSNPNKKENLGYIIENKFLKNIFFNKILSNKKIIIKDKINIQSLERNEHSVTVYGLNFSIKSKLLIATDGKFSLIRKLSKMTNFEKKYHHNAMVLNLFHSKNHNGVAYEIFKKNGPLAILPMLKTSKNYYRSSVVWSQSCKFNRNFDQNNNNLLSIINEEISQYIGNVFAINDKKIFKLSAHINNSFYDYRLVFVGDSAHSVHPIAGQGWNLGLRDINNLFNSINEASELGLDLGNNLILKKYNDKSYYDAFLLYQITDKLNCIFLKENFIITKLRQIGIDFIDSNKTINSLISSYAMGKGPNFSSLLND